MEGRIPPAPIERIIESPANHSGKMSFRSMEMLPKYNRGECDLNGYIMVGRDGLCFIPSNALGELYPADIFPIALLVCLSLCFSSSYLISCIFILGPLW